MIGPADRVLFNEMTASDLMWKKAEWIYHRFDPFEAELYRRLDISLLRFEEHDKFVREHMTRQTELLESIAMFLRNRADWHDR